MRLNATLIHMSDSSVIHNLDGNFQSGMKLSSFLLLLLSVILVGTVIGFGAAQIKSQQKKSTVSTSTKQTDTVQKSAGIADKKTFKDSAEGLLKEGGFEDEGSFHLERKPGDTSQNAYLTSSTVDLSQYVGKKVKVMGQTYKGQKAAWLMDVGYVEIVE